ncbi:expressed protein [Phakopsora pachyrhizi]|uniref:Expressed protein n=1 Tax=Phakopsora pachyrhizi TaxID=170000 RepID=A0AAV0BRK1_PHAPC|nr:expressed protein [Phakopsora pachyrhizi]
MPWKDRIYSKHSRARNINMNSSMTKKHLYLLLLSFTFHFAFRRASFLRLPWAKKDVNDLAMKTLAENDLAIKTLAVHDTVSDPRIQSFNDLISISKGEKPKSIPMNESNRPTVGIGPHAPGKLTGPLVPIAHNREGVAYVALTASLASSALEIVQDQLRVLHKPNNRVSYYLEVVHSENLHNLDDIFFDFKKRKFVVDFSETLKSLDNVEKWYNRHYFFRFESYDQLDRNYFSFREVALRPLSCLLIASPDIGDEGKKIAQEILKDKEVLEMIKLQFSTILVNPEFKEKIYLNFRDYLKHNRWSKGFSNIFDELTVKDQHDILNSSLENYVRFYYHCIGNIRDLTLHLNGVYDALHFFQLPQALNKLSNLNGLSHSEQELTRSVAITLINIISVPGYLDSGDFYAGIWSFAYYIVEFLMTNKNSRFLEIYQEKIHNDSLIEKIEFIKQCIALNKKVDELLPSILTIKTRVASKAWKRLGEDKVVNWFKKYFIKIDKLNSDLKAQSNQFEKHLHAYIKSTSHPELYNRSSKEYISSKLGGLLNTSIIEHFLSRDKAKFTSGKFEIKRHLEIINKAASCRGFKLKEFFLRKIKNTFNFLQKD